MELGEGYAIKVEVPKEAVNFFQFGKHWDQGAIIYSFAFVHQEWFHLSYKSAVCSKSYR
jgi:hypothetical protein